MYPKDGIPSGQDGFRHGGCEVILFYVDVTGRIYFTWNQFHEFFLKIREIDFLCEITFTKFFMKIHEIDNIFFFHSSPCTAKGSQLIVNRRRGQRLKELLLFMVLIRVVQMKVSAKKKDKRFRDILKIPPCKKKGFFLKFSWNWLFHGNDPTYL